MSSNLGVLDWLLIAIYFVLVFGVAFAATVREKTTRKTSAGYFLAGRNVGWFVIGSSLFASNIGSEHLVGLAGTGAASGVAVGQFEILASLILLLLGWVFVPFYLKSGVFTMPEFLERRYSPAARWYLAVISIVGYVLTKISVTIAAGGIVFEALMGIDFWTGALIVVVATGVYTIFGGMRAVLYTDMLQMFVLVGGAITVAVIGLGELGGWQALRDTAGGDFFNLWRPMSDPDFPWTGILFGAPILGVWYWCTDQFIVQRVLSAKDQDNARRGTIFGGFLKILPIFIFVIPGVIAYALAQSGKLDLARADQALPTLIGALLPVGLRGLVIAGLLAALMSSLSSVFNSCSTLITWDIYRKLRPEATERGLVIVGQLSTGVLVVLGLLWIPMMESISTELYKYLQSVQAYISPPIAAVFLVGIFWKRVNAGGAIASLITGFILGMGRLGAELGKEHLDGALLWYADINFLHFAIFLFLICSAVLVGVSLLGAAPSDHKLAGLTYATPGGRDPGAPPSPLWRRRDLQLTLILACSVAAVWIYFTGGPEPGVQRAQAPATAPHPRVSVLMAELTLEEKIGQLSQYAGSFDEAGGASIDAEFRPMVMRGEVGSFLSAYGADLTCEWQRLAVEQSRRGIPLLFAFDVIHGFRTTFPVPLAEAASWDPVAVETGARVAASEATAAGIHWTFAPMVDVSRDARWGRIVESAGEDPYLGAVMAAARVRGFQGIDLSAPDTLLACAKHFVAYGAAEAGRDYATVDISERTLRDVYLPPFAAAVNAGVTTIMTAFNEIGGVPMTSNDALLNGVLRGQLGFDGIIVSDWKSISQLIDHGVAAGRLEAAALAMKAGVDVDMVSGTYAEALAEHVRAGRVSKGSIDRAVRRVLDAKARLGLFDDPYRYCTNKPSGPDLPEAHRASARRVAQESIVLLKNDGPVLPLSRDIATLAVIGPLADDAASCLGPWAAPARPADAITVLAGLREALPSEASIMFAAGCDTRGADTSGFAAAVIMARRADAVVLVLGERAAMSGEASSRSSIDLPGPQEALAEAVLAVGKPTVVVLMNGRPLAIPHLAAQAPAIVETWFLGVETGHAVGDVLFGDINPGGKLPVTFPSASGQEPLYYNAKNTGRPADPNDKWTSKFLDVPIPPLFPFGHGLSYTRFEYDELEVSPPTAGAGDTVTVSFRLRNVGDRAGDEVAQLYVRDLVASVTRPIKELKGFLRVPLAARESKRVRFALPVSLLAFTGADGRRVVEPGKIDIMVGSSYDDVRLRGVIDIAGDIAVAVDSPARLTLASTD